MDPMTYFIVVVATMVISYGVAMMNQPKPPKVLAGQLDVPTAEEGGEIGVCFGENIIKQSNVVWYGDPSTTKIKTKSGK